MAIKPRVSLFFCLLLILAINLALPRAAKYYSDAQIQKQREIDEQRNLEIRLDVDPRLSKYMKDSKSD